LRYIDSGARAADQALGAWLEEQLQPDVTQLRWQTGFFSAEGLAVFANTLSQLKLADSLTHLVIGSNDGCTLKSHVLQLMDMVGIPRSSAKLGAVSYSGSYFHPKTYHIRRKDGSQAAYVGSANLGLSGLGALHIEAGLLLDSRDGDSTPILDQIANAVDAWFLESRAGFELVDSASTVDGLSDNGVFALLAPPRPSSSSSSGGSSTPTRPRLKPLVRFASIATVASAPAHPSTPTASTAAAVGIVATVGLPAVPQSPYPPYVLFAPGSIAPTTGQEALTGSGLPGGSVGLILRLNKDSARHWRGGSGTANISIPVPTVSTLRFGVFRGKFIRPRSEYVLEMRYVAETQQFRSNEASTNVMVYGYSPGETGHGDVRMVVPAGPAREILNFVQSSGFAAPSDGHVAILEWPNLHQPSFRLSLLDPKSNLFSQAEATLNNAAATNQLVGQGACWLPPGISPNW
jgi:hypothetical protein